MYGREPVLIAAALAAILQGVWMLISNDASVDTSAWGGALVPLVTLAAGWLARRKVMPVKTIKEAGLSPASVKAAAAEPGIAPHEGA